MKKIAFILIFSIFSFFSNAWGQEAQCPSPTPYVTASNATSCTLAWNSVVEANYYIIEVYKAGSSDIVQTLETSETSIAINNLDSNQSYEAVVYSVCNNGKSPSIRTYLPIIVEDVIMFLCRLEPGTFIKKQCKTHLQETCKNKNNPYLGDLMQYGGNIFKVQTGMGHFLEWQCRIDNNELVFSNSTNNRNILIEPITISTHHNPNTIVGLAFKDATSRTLLWRLMETRTPNRQVSFDLIFDTNACLTIESCQTTIIYTPQVCEQTPALCSDKGSQNRVLRLNQNGALTVVPNPFWDDTTVKLNVDETTEASVSIYDVTGKEIISLYKGILERGNHEFKWNSSSLLRGLYFIKVKTPTREFVQKVIKL